MAYSVQRNVDLDTPSEVAYNERVKHVRCGYILSLATALALVTGCGRRPDQNQLAAPTGAPTDNSANAAPAEVGLPTTISTESVPVETVIVSTSRESAPPSPASSVTLTTFVMNGFVFSFPASLGLSPVPNHHFVVNDPIFPSESQDFSDGRGHLVTMTIASGGKKLIDTNASAGSSLATVQVGDRTFYTPEQRDDPNSYSLMLVVGDKVAAFGFSLFQPNEALALVKDIDVNPVGR